jgi:glutamyl-tRNA reductase
MTTLGGVLTHRTLPLAELEQVAVVSERLPALLDELAGAPAIDEVIVLSTCNRTELYLSTTDRSANDRTAIDDAVAILEDVLGLPAGWVRPRLQVLEGEAVPRHLFRVTAGLDAMVPGEPDVQGQVREALNVASDAGHVGPDLHGLFAAALRSGRAVRAGSGLAETSPSVLQVGVQAVADRCGGLRGRRVVIVGAGRVARSLGRLLRAGGAELAVLARRPETARWFADDLGADVRPSSALADTLRGADAVVMATSAPHPLLLAADLLEVIADRRSRPLVVLDLGLPRNVDPELAGLPGVDLYDLQRLSADDGERLERWSAALAAAERVLDEEVAAYGSAMRARTADDVLSVLHRRAEVVVAAEVGRACRRAPDHGTGSDLHSAIETAVWRATRKLLHEPTARLRSAAASGDLERLEVAAWLFGLEPANGEERGP